VKEKQRREGAADPSRGGQEQRNEEAVSEREEGRSTRVKEPRNEEAHD
jgi:hypothetical protein